MPLGETRDQRSPDAGSRGAYGLRIEGLPDADGLLHRVDGHDLPPAVTVERVAGGVPDGPTFGDDVARFALQGGLGHAEITRGPLTVRLHLARELPDESVVHPCLALPAATISWWLGRISLHGGAFVSAGGAALAILGDKEAGKTTTLATMHAAGRPVVADDVLTIDGGDVFAGPACIDLRSESAAFLDGSRSLGQVGERERWRLDTRPARWRTPLGGFVVPVWGDEITLTPIPLEQRLKVLYANQSLFVPPKRPEAMLDLIALPFWELRRPRDLASLAPTLELLHDLGG